MIGRNAKDVGVYLGGEENALDYVVGYPAADYISKNQSQWCFSKGFDASCSIGRGRPILLVQSSTLTISL